MEIKSYIEENKARFLDELFELIRIPSISAEASHKDDMLKMAEALKANLLKSGADTVEILPTDGHPVVYAEKTIDPKLPTILVYGHYDVQPVEPLDLWKSPPFEPEIRNEKIYARGADDDKGQSFMQVKAFEYLVATNQLPCNVKFMLEGEEEVGSPSLASFCKQNKEKLAADIILISDTTMISLDIPSVTVGLRGLTYLQVEVTGPGRDLHSGLYGGAVANPINVLSKMIASLKDENNHIAIPGFYDDVVVYSEEQRKKINDAPFELEKYKAEIDITDVDGEEGYTTLERLGIRPTLDVCGIWGGHTGEGAKTVLPSKAYAKISMRIVPNQSPEKIEQLFIKHFKKIAPNSVKVKVETMHGGNPYMSPLDSPAYKAAQKAIVETFGKEPVPDFSGASIPIVSTFEEILGVKSLLLGFGLKSDAIHSPNENYPLANFFKGIETIPVFYKYFAELASASK